MMDGRSGNIDGNSSSNTRVKDGRLPNPLLDDNGKRVVEAVCQG